MKKVHEFWYQLSCNSGLQFVLHTSDSSCAGLINTTAFLEQLVDARYVTILNQTLHEEKSKHVALAEQNGFGPVLFAQFAEASYNKGQQSLTPAREECNK
jgi:hypothetical protein